MVVLAQMSRYRCATPASGGYSKTDVTMKRVWIVLSLLLVLGGCGSESGFTEADLRIPVGFLRVVHAMPDSPNLRIELQTQALGSLNYGDSTPFRQVLPEINRTLEISYFNGTDFTMVTEETINIGLDHAVTVVISGTLAAPQIFSFEEPASTGENIPIRFINAAGSAGTYDIYLTQDDDPAVSPVAQLSQFEDLKVERVAAENYRLRFANSDSSDILWDSGIFTLPENITPVFVLADNFGSSTNPVRMLSADFESFPEDQTQAELQLAQMIPDTTGLVDVYMDGELVASELDYRDITDYQSIVPGAKLVTVTESGLPENIIDESTLFVTPGDFQSISIFNTLAFASTVLNREDLRRVPNNVSLTISHFAPSAGIVTLYVTGPGEDFQDFNSIVQMSVENTQTLVVAQADYDLVLTDPENNEVIRTTLPAADGALYRLYLTDTPGGGSPVELLRRGDLQDQ